MSQLDPNSSDRTADAISPPSLVAALTALREGDFTVRLPENREDSAGQEGDAVAAVFNDLAAMLAGFDAELRRVARELGTEGRFGPQAEVPEARGEWAALVGEVNTMAANLTNQFRNIAAITGAIAAGERPAPLVTVDAQGEVDQLKQSLNRYAATLNGQ